MPHEFKHDEKDIYKSINISEERLEEVQKEINMARFEEESFSHVIERLSVNLTPVELAFSVMSLGAQLVELKLRSARK